MYSLSKEALKLLTKGFIHRAEKYALEEQIPLITAQLGEDKLALAERYDFNITYCHYWTRQTESSLFPRNFKRPHSKPAFKNFYILKTIRFKDESCLI